MGQGISKFNTPDVKQTLKNTQYKLKKEVKKPEIKTLNLFGQTNEN